MSEFDNEYTEYTPGFAGSDTDGAATTTEPEVNAEVEADDMEDMSLDEKITSFKDGIDHHIAVLTEAREAMKLAEDEFDRKREERNKKIADAEGEMRERIEEVRREQQEIVDRVAAEADAEVQQVKEEAEEATIAYKDAFDEATENPFITRNALSQFGFSKTTRFRVSQR